MSASTLQDLLDRVAIRELTARYNMSVDNGDIDGYVRTFIPDGVFYVSADQQLRGHEQIKTFSQHLGFGCVHMTTDAIIEINGDRARQTCYLLVMKRQRDRQNITPITTGCYHDTLVRTPEGWRFESRKADCDVALDLVLARLSGG